MHMREVVAGDRWNRKSSPESKGMLSSWWRMEVPERSIGEWGDTKQGQEFRRLPFYPKVKTPRAET